MKPGDNIKPFVIETAENRTDAVPHVGRVRPRRIRPESHE